MRLTLAIPVYNESSVLATSIVVMHRFLSERMTEYEWQIIIADNGSTDGTGEIADLLAAQFAHVVHERIPIAGKGGAIRTAWEKYPAEVYAFMDVDLSTDIEAFPALIQAISDGADIASGSRAHPESHVERSLRRRSISYLFRLWIWLLFDTGVHDTPCGFKAVTPWIVKEVVPTIKDNSWFFDTELVVRTTELSMRVVEIPIVWREFVAPGRQSRVSFFAVTFDYLRKSLSLWWELNTR